MIVNTFGFSNPGTWSPMGHGSHDGPAVERGKKRCINWEPSRQGSRFAYLIFFFSSIFFCVFLIYLLTYFWPHVVLAAACGIFVVACGIFAAHGLFLVEACFSLVVVRGLSCLVGWWGTQHWGPALFMVGRTTQETQTKKVKGEASEGLSLVNAITQILEDRNHTRFHTSFLHTRR